MYSCQRTEYVHRIEVVERVQLLLETYQETPTNKRKTNKQKKKAHGKTKHKCHNLGSVNLFSVHYNFVLDVRQSYVHSLMRAHP